MKEYDQIADWYSSHRNIKIGISAVSQFINTLQPGSTVLDIGCGDGIPLSGFVIQNGFKVYGIDSSAKMVEKFKKNFPDVPVQCSNVLDSDFFGLNFDAVIAYGLMFHLTPAHQSTLMAKIAKHLNNEGKLLFDSGNVDGEGESIMNGVRFPQYSMSSRNYEKVLDQNGFTLLKTYQYEESGGYLYIAQKNQPSEP